MKNKVFTKLQARASENLYAEEMRLRKEIEEALAKVKDEVEKMKIQQVEVKEQLRKTRGQKSLLQNQLEESYEMEKELEQKILSAVDLLKNYKEERDELLRDRDNALRQAEELRKNQTENPSMHIPRIYSEFSFFEIEEATQRFSPSQKIGEGGYGSIYKGRLRHTEVAIKRLNPQSMQGPSEFQQEVISFSQKYECL